MNTRENRADVTGCLRYVEHAPDPVLGRYIECYWSVAGRVAPDQSARVLPDGCMDILFNLGESLRGADGSPTSPTVVGSMTRAITVSYRGRVELVGVRFRPGGATPWLDVPASEITDRVVGLDPLWGSDAARAHERLREVEASSRIGLLNDILIARLRRSRRSADERVMRASEAVAGHAGSLPVESLADATGLGRRQLERRFLACVGVPPKRASRIARFRSVVARMHAGPTTALWRLALDAGYADQAHMSREFRALAGITPGAYVADIGGT